MNKFMTENTEHSNEHVYFINQLYRDFLLPTILGDDNATILYWQVSGLHVTTIWLIWMI